MAKKRSNNKENVVHIVMVLDESSSMSSIRASTISAFNEFLASQQKLPGVAVLSLLKFSSQSSWVYEDRLVESAPNLSYATYQPDGMTALYDAIGTAYAALVKKEAQRAIICVLTDGEENSSRRFNRNDIHRISTAVRERGWDMLYLGANQNAEEVGASMGLLREQTRSFAATNAGIGMAMNTSSAYVASYRQSSDNLPK